MGNQIDDVAFWSTVVPGSEITDLAQMDVAVEDVTGTLVAYYDFEDGSGLTASDNAGSNNGVLEGNMTIDDWVYDDVIIFAQTNRTISKPFYTFLISHKPILKQNPANAQVL